MKELRTCKQCDKRFEIHMSWIRKGGGSYCSRRCKGEASRGKTKEGSRATRAKICRVCLKDFVPGRKSTQHEWDRSLCSRECWHKSNRKSDEHKLMVLKANSKKKNLKMKAMGYPKQKAWAEKNRRQYVKEAKLECFDAYGGRACACCGENMIEFLTLDHIHNDADIHMEETGAPRGAFHLYSWLRRRGYPYRDRFQVLCMNCNWAKSKHGGMCPHQIEARRIFLVVG
jgi:hypothetical protein